MIVFLFCSINNKNSFISLLPHSCRSRLFSLEDIEMKHSVCFLLLTIHMSYVTCRLWPIALASTKGTCAFNGYKPGGNAVTVSKIEAPVATLQASALSKIASLTSKTAGLSMHSINALKAFGDIFSKIAPKLASSLGVFGAVMGFVTEFTKPTPADIIKATNKAISKLTNEVNTRLDEMKGYVDHKILLLEKELINREYKTLFNMWGNCIGELDADLVRECQKDALKQLRASSPKFLLKADQRNVWTTSNRPAVNDVKRIEVGLLSFRDYAVLDLMQLETISDTYKDVSTELGKKYYIKFLKELVTDSKKFIDYAKFGYKWIEDLHITRTSAHCQSSYNCTTKDVWEGFIIKVKTVTKFSCSCAFSPVILESAKCEEKMDVRVDGKTPEAYLLYNYNVNSYKEAGIEFGRRTIYDKHSIYSSNLKAVVEKYWKVNILDMIPTWESIYSKAVEAVSEAQSSDEPAVDEPSSEEYYSPRFKERYVQAVRSARSSVPIH